MIKDFGVLMMMGSMAVNVPSVLQDNNKPQLDTLSGYVEAANSGDLAPDPIIRLVTDLCPVILEASEGQQNVYADQMSAACGLLQSSSSNNAQINNLLAMVE